ncbi:MAG: CpXC domain-containing protein [Eubacterium sp.]|nr:CpXC domain-containing protein [Eubacterium sp.]
MSIKHEVDVTCPNCRTPHPFGVWESINTSENPEMRSAVRDKSAFLFVCPTCGEKSMIDYGFLYHQMEDKIIIYYADSDARAEEIKTMLAAEDASDMVGDLRKGKYLVRVVRSLNELREKLAIFDAGLDDRIIEIYKIYVLSVYRKEHPDDHDIQTLYVRDPNGKRNLIQIIAGGKTGGVSEIPEGFYKELCLQHLGSLPDLREDEPFIDRRWALEKMGLSDQL